MKRIIIRAIIKNRADRWVEEFSAVIREDITPKEYVISVINNRNLIARPQQLSEEYGSVRIIPELTMDMNHDWSRSGTARRGKDDHFICKRCGWNGIRKPGSIEINAAARYSKTPNICHWHI